MRALFVLSIAALGASAAAGCAMFEGLSDHATLVTPSPRALELPGVRLARGAFTELTYMSAGGEAFAIAAKAESEGTPRLRLFRPRSEDLSLSRVEGAGDEGRGGSGEVPSCDAGPVTDFVVDWHARNVVRIFFDEDGDGRGTLRSVDVDCHEVADSLDDVDWGGRTDCLRDPERACVSVFQAGPEVYRTSEDGLQILATGVTDSIVVDDFLYTVEGEEVVRRALFQALPEVRHTLPGASFEHPTGRGRYGNASILTENGHYAWRTNLSFPHPVEANSCAYAVAYGALAFLSPCTDGNLVLRLYGNNATSGFVELRAPAESFRPAEVVVRTWEDGRGLALVWLHEEGTPAADPNARGRLMGTEWDADDAEVPPLTLIDSNATLDVDHSSEGLATYRIGVRCLGIRCDTYAGFPESLETLLDPAKAQTWGYWDIIKDTEAGFHSVEVWEGMPIELVEFLDGGATVASRTEVPDSQLPAGEHWLGFAPIDADPNDIYAEYLALVRGSRRAEDGELQVLGYGAARLSKVLAKRVVVKSLQGLGRPSAVLFRTSDAPADLQVVYVGSELSEVIPDVAETLHVFYAFPGLLYATTGEDAALWYAPPKY